eukprot:TRINITY_DN2349_c0_g2_i6.p1 TRINITY_DN2349_c0_g2~~TRINITY_DN2349_c0_g2_i6.p1  ORF type:complete len:264 (-),score=57.62 TRINITY_DN2349_c0_g2_i6:168-959(-)
MIRQKESQLQKVEKSIISNMKDTTITNPKLPHTPYVSSKSKKIITQEKPKQASSQVVSKPILQQKAPPLKREAIMLDSEDEKELEEIRQKADQVYFKNEAKRYLLEYARRSSAPSIDVPSRKESRAFCTGSLSKFERLQISDNTHDSTSQKPKCGKNIIPLMKVGYVSEGGTSAEKMDSEDSVDSQSDSWRSMSPQASDEEEDIVPAFVQDDFGQRLQKYLFGVRPYHLQDGDSGSGDGNSEEDFDEDGEYVDEDDQDGGWPE